MVEFSQTGPFGVPRPFGLGPLTKPQERDTNVPPPVPDSFREPDVYSRRGLLSEVGLAGTNPGAETNSIIGFAFLDANDTLVASSNYNHLELIGAYLRDVNESPTRAVPFKSGIFGPVEVPGGGGFATKAQEYGYDLTEDDILFSGDLSPPTGLYYVAYTARAAGFSADRRLRYMYDPTGEDSITRIPYRMQDLYQELRFANHDPGVLRDQL